MPFQYSEQHFTEYVTAGVTVLRGLIPPSLLADLRHEAEKARPLARSLHGAQAQRLQPVYAHEDLAHRPFRDFLALPGLRAAVQNILSPQHEQSDIMGILLEPADLPWCTAWHRDWGYNQPSIDLPAFFAAILNLKMFNQINAALYDDHSLWVVPGSHNRPDKPAETQAFACIPPPPPEMAPVATVEERERVCVDYARRMPGATPILLLAGDVAFYRSCQWHIGTYTPHAKRATLHDGFYGPEDRAWHKSVREMQADAAARGAAVPSGSPSGA